MLRRKTYTLKGRKRNQKPPSLDEVRLVGDFQNVIRKYLKGGDHFEQVQRATTGIAIRRLLVTEHNMTYDELEEVAYRLKLDIQAKGKLDPTFAKWKPVPRGY